MRKRGGRIDETDALGLRRQPLRQSGAQAGADTADVAAKPVPIARISVGKTSPGVDAHQRVVHRVEERERQEQGQLPLSTWQRELSEPGTRRRRPALCR